MCELYCFIEKQMRAQLIMNSFSCSIKIRFADVVFGIDRYDFGVNCSGRVQYRGRKFLLHIRRLLQVP